MLSIDAMNESVALQTAIERAGGRAAIAAALGIKRQAIAQWDRCPVARVLEVERISGVPRHFLRPDIYPFEPASREGAAA